MLKVLIVVPDLKVANGVASFSMNYFRKINHNEVKVDFVVFHDGLSPYYKEIQEAGGTIYKLPPISSVFRHYKMCKEIVSNQYDIIHNNSLHITLPLMMAAKNKISTRILHSHSSKLGETRKKEVRNKLFLPFLRGMATDYAACSGVAGEAMFGKQKVAVIPNVINEDKFCFNTEVREKIRSAFGAEGKFIVATVGRIAYQKNPFFAVDLFNMFLEKNPDAEYWWIGNGPLQEEVAAYIEEKNLKDKIKLFGSRTDINELYQAIDCFFLPSLFEGLPVVGVEAQAMGLPCVVADTITKEMSYTDLVKYISLDASPEEWCKAFFWTMTERDREKYNQELRNSQFASANAGRVLEEYYKQLVEKNSNAKGFTGG